MLQSLKGPEQIQIKAPMAGTVADINPILRPGIQIEKHTELLILERMKLFSAVTAPCRGIVTEVMTGPGKKVLEGETLIKMVSVHVSG